MLFTILSSYKTMTAILLILAIGAAAGTFVENDFGSIMAKNLIYNSVWYQGMFFLASINMGLVIYKTKMWRVKTRVLFHISFMIILIGASITYTFGIDGTMSIDEKKSSNIIVVQDEKIIVPFFIQLNDFELIRYPGSRSPSEYSSDITVIDTKNDTKFKTSIYMNHTLTYQGYKFFQTSYPKDEKGTILSVNKDPGVEVTYIGYTLLFLSLFLNLFDKKSRFQFLIQKVKKMPIASFLLPLFCVAFLQTPSLSNDTQYIVQYLNDHKNNSQELADAFGSLIVQDPVGRMKPLDTQNREVLNKLSGKDTWQGMSANQVMLGMFSRPSIWKKVKIIKVKTPQLRKKLGVNEVQKYVTFMDFFDASGNYKLTDDVEKANQKVPSARGTYDRDLIQVDERLNISFMSYRGVLLTIFPLPNDKKDKWVDFKTMFSKVDNSAIKRSTSRLLDAAYNRNYSKGLQYVKDIQNYQYEVSPHLIPSVQKIKIERDYNESGLFFKLSMLYLLLGVSFLIYGITSMFFNTLIHKRVQLFISSTAFILFAVHTFGIAIRWYIGGYAPISNTYESMVYISYSSIIVSVVFFRKSVMALSASFIMAGIFIFAAYLGEIDPQITNLVPVLKSYWLSVHVSVITASYGFFGVGAILGVVSLILFILKSEKRKHLDIHIKNITYINEITLILGLVLLVVGNFLGAIWANESWGRYWGWDPKETWAYISILIYTVVLHLRLIKNWYSPYLFTILSVVAFSSILMTYFGVNFYLAGMHSYATGDPVPIPQWVYITTGMIVVLIALSYSKRKLTN